MFKHLLITLSAAAFLAGGMALPAQAAGPDSGVQLAADSSHKKVRKQRTKGKVREAASKPKGRVIRGAKPKGTPGTGQPKGIVAQSDKPKPGDKNKIVGPSDRNKIVGPSDRNKIVGPSDRNKIVAPSD